MREYSNYSLFHICLLPRMHRFTSFIQIWIEIDVMVVLWALVGKMVQLKDQKWIIYRIIAVLAIWIIGIIF